MSFFLPSRLIDFEYFGDDYVDEEYEQLAKPYQKEIDFAFFAANFGYSKEEYEALTPKEKAFLYKAYENKEISMISNIYTAVFTAVYNANRPKNKKALKPLKKKSQKKADMNIVKSNLQIITEVEAKEGRSWIDLIYKVNHMRKPKGGQNV